MYLTTDIDSHPDVRRMLRAGVIKNQGRKVTLAELRAACDEARAKGWKVFPHDGCVRIRPDGMCADARACEAERNMGGGI